MTNWELWIQKNGISKEDVMHLISLGECSDCPTYKDCRGVNCSKYLKQWAETEQGKTAEDFRREFGKNYL